MHHTSCLVTARELHRARGAKSFSVHVNASALHTRRFSEAEQTMALRKVQLDNSVCRVPPAIFHSLLSLSGTHPISLRIKTYYYHYCSALKSMGLEVVRVGECRPVARDLRKKRWLFPCGRQREAASSLRSQQLPSR